jgi:polyhydroxyalkanoate synthesis regulator phasin
MTDLLLQFGVSNLIVSLALAVVAWAVHATGRRPLVAHLLWVLVLAKLVTPPILTVPVLPAPARFKMIVSNTPIVRTQRWVRASIVVCAAGLLPLGVVTAEVAPPEGDVEANAAADPDVLLDILAELIVGEAIDPRLAHDIYVAAEEPLKQQLVAAGRITPEAFDERLAIAMRFKVAELTLERAVAEGELTEEEARARLGEMRRAMAGEGDRDNGMLRRIAGVLGEAGIPREQIRPVLRAMHRIAGEIQAEGDAFELDPGMQAYLEELGLSGEQIELVVGLSERLTVARAERGGDDVRARWESLRRRVEAGVESGEMTREQADELYRQLRERLHAARRDR